MKHLSRIFSPRQTARHDITWNDVVVLTGIAILIYAGLYAARRAPAFMETPDISLSPLALPWYALLSVRRMAVAYCLTMLFALVYGYFAASNRRVEQVLIPLLDVLQSVPILSFLPVALLSLSAILPQKRAVELASVVLIFTSQVWHLTFAWYQSLITVPKELQEAATIFRFNRWMRFKTLEFPFAAVSMIWNSMMSWAGGWFFLMATEIFTVGNRDFRLPGLGAYLHEAASSGDIRAIFWGVGVLIVVIVALDQFVWCPLLAWSERFKLEMVETGRPAGFWFYDLLRNALLVTWIKREMLHPAMDFLDRLLVSLSPMKERHGAPEKGHRLAFRLFTLIFGLGMIAGSFLVARMLASVPPAHWGAIGIGLGATMLRVLASILIALAWTVPAGVIIGTNQRLAVWVQPVIQIAASIPATALFPIFVLMLMGMPGGINCAAILLMLTGAQWYLLFNVIAGAMLIPQDLKYTSALLGMGRTERWSTLILPALFPYIITGAITASGGAWNASIVAEYVQFGGKILSTPGIGTIIVQATAAGDYPLLLAATLSMIVTVTVINLLFWRRLYHLAVERYRME